MISIRAGYYEVSVTNPTERVSAVCRAYATAPPPAGTGVVINHQAFLLSDPGWSEEDGVFTATMWRVRKQNLPSKMVDGKTVQVESDLGESASFAYIPQRREALVQYNHNGPRHTLVSAFLEAIGVSEPVALTPVINSEAIGRMKHAPLIRRLEFALGDIADEKPLRGAGLGGFLDQLKGLKGTSIRVEVSLGHHPGGLTEDARKIATALSEMVSGVKTVKVGVKEGEDQATEMLDLLGGRLFIDLNLPENGRELDRAVCRDRLRQALKNRVVTSDESEDDDDDESTDGAPAPQQS